jgi:ketosteroid isomerase-like protein
MSQENVEIVRLIYDAWAAGDFTAGADALDEHVVFVVSPDFPAWGVFLGLDGVRNYMRDFLEQWERFTVEAEGVEDVGDTVLVRARQRMQGKTSGVEGDMPFFMLFTFRGKKIVRLESIKSERGALEAAGLSEQDAQSS